MQVALYKDLKTVVVVVCSSLSSALVIILACHEVGTLSAMTPFPQTDIIGAMVIVWRVRGKNYQVCSVQYCVQQLCTVHTHMNGPNSSLDWVLSHWAHFTVLRFIFVYVMYVFSICLYIVCICRFVTW